MRFLVLLLVAILAACGGGGGEGNTSDGDLEVSFSGYSSPPVTAFKALSFSPNLSDLNGNRPSFRVISGSLPAGVSLDSRTGYLTGVPTQSGTFTVQIELKVDGFSGEISSWATLFVRPVSLTYTGSAGASFATEGTTFGVGVPLRPFSLYLLDQGAYSNGTFGLGELEPAGGVTVAYRVAAGSALPSGLTLNTETGEITGTPSAVGTLSSRVEAVISYDGNSFFYAATIPFAITAPTATLAYAPLTFSGDMCISTTSVPFGTVPVGGTAVTFTPTITGAQPGDVVSNFSANPVSLQGLTLDPNTGVISGTSFAPNNFCGTSVAQFPVSYTVTRGSYSSTLTANVEFVQ